MMPPFGERVRSLPALGVGVSTEYGAAGQRGGLDLEALRARFPQYGAFLEVGVETAVGVDAHARGWVQAGGRTTYHFLDVNLDEPEDFDPAWLDDMQAAINLLRPAWLCGDAGLWHFGARDRGQMLLLPPILTASVAAATAEGVVRLRERFGLEVLPENPPGIVFGGDLHLLEFYAELAERADTGIVLDAAHLAIYQALHGHDPLVGFDGFPLERVVELHVAGGRHRSVQGFPFIEDEHGPTILPETWRIVEAVVSRAPNLKAIVFECERNPLHALLPAMGRLHRLWCERGRREGEAFGSAAPARGAPLELEAARHLQQELVLRLFAPAGAPPRPPLAGVDPRVFAADPLRPTRLVGALLEEYPFTGAILGAGGLEAFLWSPEWEACVRNRGSLALAFGAWASGRAGAGARLELEIARARRVVPSQPADGRVHLAPGGTLAWLPSGVYACWEAAHQGGPLAERVAAGLRLPRPVEGDAGEWVYVRPAPDGVRVEALPDAVGELLQAVGAGLPHGAVVGEAMALGAALDEANEVVDGLLADGLLVRAPGPAGG